MTSKSAPAEILCEARRSDIGLPGVWCVRLGACGHKFDQVPRERHLSSPVAFECDGRLCPGEPREALCELQRVTAFDDHVGIGVRPAKELVAHVAADDPGAHAQLRRRLLEESENLVVRESPRLGRRSPPAEPPWFVGAPLTPPI